MQILENPSNSDIGNAIIQLREELGAQIGQLSEQLEKLDYKFDVYPKGTDGMV